MRLDKIGNWYRNPQCIVAGYATSTEGRDKIGLLWGKYGVETDII
jgi:hypothetical protein